MRGDKSALTQDIHPPYAPRSRIKCDSRTFQRFASPNPPKTSLYGNRRLKTRKFYSHQPGGCRAGKFGEMREVWRGNGDFATQNLPVAALPRWTHLRKGGPSPSKVFSLPPPHHSKQTAEADGDSAHVGNLVDFDLRVNATRGLQNGANLVGRYRVNTATERD